MKQKRSKKERLAATPAPRGGFRHADHAEIPEDALSFREQKVLGVLRGLSGPLTVRELGRKCFPGMRAKPGTYESMNADGATVRHGTGAAYRCVLNSLRRLVAGGFAKKVERGSYVATAPTTAATAAATTNAKPRRTAHE